MSVLKDPRCRIARHIFRVQTSDKHCCRFLVTFRCLCRHLQKHSCRNRRSLASDIVVQQLTIVYPELLQATVDDFKHSPPLLGILYTEESTVCGSSLIRSVIIWFLASSPSATRHHPGPYHGRHATSRSKAHKFKELSPDILTSPSSGPVHFGAIGKALP